jgi:hypothetical protein
MGIKIISIPRHASKSLVRRCQALSDGGAASTTDAQKDARSTISASVRYLLALHQWDKFTGYLHVGGYFNDDNSLASRTPDVFLNNSPVARNTLASAFSIVAGYQPEIVLMNHLAVSTLFGLAIAVAPDFKVGIIGEGVSIVNGVNFRILF